MLFGFVLRVVKVIFLHVQLSRALPACYDRLGITAHHNLFEFLHHALTFLLMHLVDFLLLRFEFKPKPIEGLLKSKWGLLKR